MSSSSITPAEERPTWRGWLHVGAFVLSIPAGVLLILGAAGWPQAGGTVVVVGHQPTLGRAAALLMTGDAADWSVRKGALWWFTCRIRGNNYETVLRAVIAPDLV